MEISLLKSKVAIMKEKLELLKLQREILSEEEVNQFNYNPSTLEHMWKLTYKNL